MELTRAVPSCSLTTRRHYTGPQAPGGLGGCPCWSRRRCGVPSTLLSMHSHHTSRAPWPWPVGGMAATATPSWPHATPESSHMLPEASGGAREVAWRGGECSSRWACKWGCEARRWVLSWWARSTCRLPWPRQHGDQAPPNDLAVVDITHPIAIGPCPIATNPQGTSPVAWQLP